MIFPSQTIQLKDGYNGQLVWFWRTPIARDGDLVKLRCAEKGREYMTSWRHKSDTNNSYIPSATRCQ